MKGDKPSRKEAAKQPLKDRPSEMESEDASTRPDLISEDQQTNSPSVNILDRAVLSLAGHKLPPSDAAARTLAQFRNLHRLDLSDMKASEESIHGLTDVNLLVRAQSLSKKHAKKNGTTTLADRLTWLNLSNNKALGETKNALDGLDLFTALHVLNLSNCAMKVFPSGLKSLEQLKALVLSHNEIDEIPYAVPHLPDLNTLVLSNNRVTRLPNTLPASLPNLKKISLSHNLLENGNQLPDFSVCSHLREVRLSGNPSLKTLPEHLGRWGCGVEGGAPGLALLDVSDCGLDTWDSVAPLLKSNPTKRKGIVNLCLKNNGVTAEQDYEEKIRAAFPAMSILDNVRLRPKKATKTDTIGTSESVVSTETEAPKYTPQDGSDEQAASNSRTTASRTRNVVNHSDASSHATSSSKSHNKASTKQKRAHDSDDDRGKKIRKRSGRGSKHAKSEMDQGVDAEHARLLARAGPAPSEYMDSDQDLSGVSPSEEDSIPYRTNGGSSSLRDSENVVTSSKPKKTRRKKRGSHTVELEMEVSDETTRSSEPAKQDTTSKQPSAQRSPSPQPAVQETGVVDIVQKRKPKQSQPLSLARRDEDLAGW
ncbi:hypothetical protein MYAM1_000255 [Malassezia yamatoensis]|uniref:Uncharacterized protein n=1 Tax=Malassezia yamatoensis TaxID=253288 RepID=A0AAJ6CH79_9BASI|nr:hypothetical protein MYAM1_000255 [Malassezia yamatoensis]